MAKQKISLSVLSSYEVDTDDYPGLFPAEIAEAVRAEVARTPSTSLRAMHRIIKGDDNGEFSLMVYPVDAQGQLVDRQRFGSLKLTEHAKRRVVVGQ